MPEKQEEQNRLLHHLDLFASPVANLVILLLPLVYVPTMNILSKKDCL